MCAKFMNQKKDRVPSPCVDICILDDEKICLGCFRSIGEIVQWPQMDDTMRRDVLLKSECRRKKYDLKDERDV